MKTIHAGTEKVRKGKLTSRQKAILDFVRGFIEKNQFPPTRREIANAFQFSSTNAAEQHLRALEQKGWIRLMRSNWASIARGIQVV